MRLFSTSFRVHRGELKNRATIRTHFAVLLILICHQSLVVAAEKDTLSLRDAVSRALTVDRWQVNNRLKQQVRLQEAKAASTYSDPTVSVKLMNLPSDSWDFSQEGMTQFSVGITQPLPRGDTLALREQKLRTEAKAIQLQQADRRAQITRRVSSLWLDAYLAQYIIQLIKADRALFVQMVEIAKANYSSTIGKTRQSDVIRAQLELVQLEDRITVEKNNLALATAKLNEWLHSARSRKESEAFLYRTKEFQLPKSLPQVALNAKTKGIDQRQYIMTLLEKVKNHPAALILETQSRIATTDIGIAEQQFKPQWSLNASYGYREDSPMGVERADLFSVGISFDLPIFTENKQDPLLAAATTQLDIVKNKRYLLIKEMASLLDAGLQQLIHLKKRQTLYQERLIKQTHDQAEAAITAYTNDDGDFAEVVRARISELNARIQAKRIDVEILKTIVACNYYLTQAKLEPSHGPS